MCVETLGESARSQPTGRVQRTVRAATAKARKYRRRPSAESVRMVGSKKRRQNSSRARNTSRRRGPLQRSSAAVRSNRTRARLNAFSKGGIATRPDGRGSLSRPRCRHSPSARPARSAASPGSCVRAWPSRVAHQCTHDVEDAGARCFVLDAAAPVRSRWSYVDHRVVFDERVTSLAEIQVNTPQ